MTKASRFAGLMASGVFCLAASAVSAEPRAIVELFTSQGCSSCPPADAYLAELASRGDVIGLSFHVDYWDYLGWKDTLASPENTDRQTQYSALRGDRKVYTPQMIVNGSAHFIGRERGEIEKAISDSRLVVPVSAVYRDDKINISVGANPRPAPWQATIRLALVSSVASVPIARGENAGATITYRNVVRSIRPIGMWDGAALSISLPADELMSGNADGCVVFVQEDLNGRPGAILGAAEITSSEP